MPASCSMAENCARVRASTSSLPTRAKESSGKPLAVSMDGSIFPFLDATLFDDFLEVESSLQALKADEGAVLNAGFCTPSNDDTVRCSLDLSLPQTSQVQGFSRIGWKQCRSFKLATTKEARCPSHQVSFTSADENKRPSGVLRPTKANSLKALGRSKAT